MTSKDRTKEQANEKAPSAVQSMEAAAPIDWEAIATVRASQLEAARRGALEALYPDGDGNLVAHAKRELERAGLLSSGSDYGGMIGRAVLDLVRVFAGEGHSGGSAGMAIDVFSRLARFDVLSPITSHPSEWMEVGTGVFQNRRKPSVFWRDGDESWYDLDAPAAEGARS